MGLNLKEKSSGTVQGQIKITKRGPSRVRQLLWLAVFRWIQTDPIANAWYQRKKQRDGGRASRAAVALMRKLAKGLYHVGRGGTFDSSKLFDTSRLAAVVPGRPVHYFQRVTFRCSVSLPRARATSVSRHPAEPYLSQSHIGQVRLHERSIHPSQLIL